MNVTTMPAADVDLSHTTFLVVEDKPHFRDIAHNALMRCRAKDAFAPDFDEALQVIKRLGPHIGGVMCDWAMEPTGGLEFLRRIRGGKIARCARDLCAVIFTGKPDAAAVKAAMALDVNGFAIAPLSVEKLAKNLALAWQRQIKLQTPEHYASVVLPEIEKSEKGIPLHGAAPTRAVKTAKQPDFINVRMCTLSQVQAGVILARDLNDRDGHLLLKAGAPLSKALLDRLNDVSGNHAESYHVWIGDRPPQ